MDSEQAAFCKLTFSDIDDFKAAITNLDVLPVQLERGALELSLTELAFEDVIVRKVHSNRKLTEEALIPAGWTNFTFTPSKHSAHGLWCGVQTYPDAVLVARSGREHHSVIPGNWTFLELAVSDELLLSQGLVSEQFLRNCMVPEAGLFKLSITASAQLQHYLESLLQAGDRLDYNSGQTKYALPVRSQILDLLANALEDAVDKGSPRRRTYRRYALLRRAHSLIDEGNWSQLNIEVLADQLNTTTRTLQRTFLEHYQISPYQFLLRRRLHGAPKAMSQSSPSSISIEQVAYRFGFSSSSQFSEHYKREFDERPSESLRRYWHVIQ